MSKHSSINSTDFYIDGKSTQRMEDIKNLKAPGSIGKQVTLCQNMANAIKDPNKAFARYEAACHVFGVDSSQSKPFLIKAAGLEHEKAKEILEDQRILRRAEAAKKREEERIKKFSMVSLTYDMLL